MNALIYKRLLSLSRSSSARSWRERRGKRYEIACRVRGYLFAGRLDESGYALRIGRRFFVSHEIGTYVRVGHNVTLYDNVRFNLDRPHATIIIGDHTYLNRNVQIFASRSITIGQRCAVGCDVVILDGGSHGVPSAPVVLDDAVWVGNGVRIMPGVTIGAGAAIGAGAVVTRDVAPGILVVGVPAVPKGQTSLRAQP